MPREKREYRVDGLKMRRLRLAAGMTLEEFTERVQLSRATVRKLMDGKPVFLESIAQAAERAFGIDNPLELLHPEELAALGVRTEVTCPDAVQEWVVEARLSPWRETTNGLQHQVARLAHRYLPGRHARGKCYELRHLPLEERERLADKLRRHAEAADRVRRCEYVAQTLTAVEVDGLWWSLDCWEEGETLDVRLAREGALDPFALRAAMTGLARALAELHAQRVVLRELSPAVVLLREADDSPVVLDLEMAKLLDARPTVAPERWPVDPYRALEVGGGGAIDPRVDLYSWGRLFAHAAAGALPERGEERVERDDVPTRVRDAVAACLEFDRRKRPAGAAALVRALRGWS